MSGDRFGFLFGRGPDESVIAGRLITELDAALGGVARQIVGAGTTLFEEGQPVDGIWLLLDGNVLLFRTIDDEEISFHQHTVGPIIGLIALARNRRTAAYSCRAIDDIEVVHIRDDELDRALHASPQLADDLTQVLLSSLGNRQRRAADQRVEIKRLNRQLETERDDLAEALDRLQRAQLRLVESEKMATLGELAAGVAHDLNNPATAIKRAADFLTEDLVTLFGAMKDPAPLVDVLYRAMTAEPLPTRRTRQYRRDLATALNDETLARRLVQVGITDFETFHDKFPDRDRVDAQLDLWELFHRVGTSMRSIDIAASRVTALVASLRSHARSESRFSSGIDLNSTIEDSLLLLGHETRGVEINRHLGDIPPVHASPNELGQVWTNLISNAVEAMNHSGILTIETSLVDATSVRVRFTDNGPGVSPENLEHIFDINYTTKLGRVEFGLGLGLTIASQIVTRHEGTIEVQSEPGNTVFTITLPIRPTTGADIE